jgi:Protein of unknown function (DUF3093)
MHSYRERLTAPVSWWITGLLVMFMFGSIVWFGFPLWVAPVTYGTLGAITAAFLGNWGRATIEIYGAELFAGGQRMSLADAGEVRALDEAQARALSGPRADPHAYLLLRPYLRKAVYIEVTAPGSAAPYWLLFSRHPAELAAAIDSSRPADRADSPAMG